MLGGNVFVVEPIGFLIGHIDHTLDAWGDEDLARASPVDVGFRGRPELMVDAISEVLDINVQPL